MDLYTLKTIVPSDLPVKVYPDTENRQLMYRITDLLQDSINQAVKIAPHFNGGDEPKKVFDFLLNQIHYKTDGFYQDIKKPYALIAIGSGDCKSMALFAASVLAVLGHDVTMRFAGYIKGSNLVNHVYILAGKTIVDPVYKKFNQEKPWQFKKDFKVKVCK